MPTYEFACPAGHQFTRFYRKMSDAAPELPCPECGQVASRKISGGAGLLFKGSGFYITDYGKDGKKSATPPAAGNPSGSDAKASDASASSRGGDAPSSSAASKADSASASGSVSAERASGSTAKKAKPAE